jgi:ATP-dependent Clp protease protease subunit
MAGEKNQSKTGEIWVNEFTERSALEFREHVISISTKDPTGPIVIYIDSYGGYVDSLAKMIDTIHQVQNLIITACIGKAMSCGAILLSCGDFRYCAPNSRIMIHEVSAGAFGDVNEMKNSVEETDRLNKHFMNLLAKNCGLKGYPDLRKIIKAHDGKDIFLGANEAVKFGIVDQVGIPKLQPRVEWDLIGIDVDDLNTIKKRQFKRTK